MNRDKMLKVMKYSDQILEIIDENLENELTRSDLQGVVEAIVIRILNDRG